MSFVGCNPLGDKSFAEDLMGAEVELVIHFLPPRLVEKQRRSDAELEVWRLFAFKQVRIAVSEQQRHRLWR